MIGLRIKSQLLGVQPAASPEEVVRWMGAMQAQEIRMVKWAVGMRTAAPSLSAVKKALDEGKILRLHIMRTTWHYIPAEDIKWMSALSCRSLTTGFNNYAKMNGLDTATSAGYRDMLYRILEGRQLTRQEIGEEFENRGVKGAEEHVWHIIALCEADGTICSGAEKESKHTYALTCERVPRPVEMSREEAMAELARRYFRSHGPATLADFVWWSGLGVREATAAINSLGADIITFQDGDRKLFTHSTAPGIAGGSRPGESVKDLVRLLPSFDEYLISYKDRFDCIRPEHTRHAYNNFGIFKTVVLHNGRITGNWKINTRKSACDTSFFDGCRRPAARLIKKAEAEYVKFLKS